MFSTLEVKFRKNSSPPHQLFKKKHEASKRDGWNDTERPADLTLFVGNVPPYYNEDVLKRLFQPCGSVKAVFFADVDSPSLIITTSKGYKVAYVVFHSAKDLEKAVLWQPKEPPILTDDEFSIVTGLREYCQEYNDNLVCAEKLQEEIDDFMAKYDQKVQEDEMAMKDNEPDEEGWVTVLKKGRNPGFARKQSVKDNIVKKMRKKRRRKELLNFYSFQIRESKLNHLSALQKKLEQDKKKIDVLKSRRMFKPFSI